MEPIAECRGVSHHINGQAVLRDIHLQIHPGETVCLIGESGCGKTVTLKLLVGLMTPTHGDAYLFGKAISRVNAAERQQLHRRLGFLFQASALFDSLTVAENIAYPLRLANQYSPTQIEMEVSNRLREVGLSDASLQKMPAELSGGMQKRVALARALATNPELVCYDEPTTGLDPVMTDVINQLIIQSRQKRPVTSIVVTHELKTIRAVATRIVMLQPLARITGNEPQMIFDGTPEAFWSSEHPLIKRFIG